MSKVITVNIHKGGVGKSTIIQQLAGVYANQGLKVVVVDGDVTASSMRFFVNRNVILESDHQLNKMPYVKCELHSPESDIRQVVKQLKTQFDIILIDTKGGPSNLFTKIIQMSDLVLIPVTADAMSFDQLHSTFSDIQQVENNIRAVDGWEDYVVDVRIVLNRTVKSSIAHSEALSVIRKFKVNYNFTKTIIPNITALAGFAANSLGATLADNKHPKRAIFELLAAELLLSHDDVSDVQDASVGGELLTEIVSV